MPFFEYRQGRLHCEEADLAAIADTVGTPCYVYSRAAIEGAWRAFDDAFAPLAHLVCYAVKANSNLAVLGLLAQLGSGFDIVSGGELARVIRAGGDPRKTVFSGVGKSAAEIRLALQAGILCFNVESTAELVRLDEVASALGTKAPVSLRINPDVDARTHQYISTGLKENKFGIAIEEAEDAYMRAAELAHIDVAGLDFHIGSQLTDNDPFTNALDRALELLNRLQTRGIEIRHLDIGGGLGIRYRDETPPSPAQYAATLLPHLRDRRYKLLLEPGRAVVGNAGLLLTRVEYLKHTAHKNFAIVDAAMNDLLRPSLYGAWQDIQPSQPRADKQALIYDVVGPVCETGDFLGKDRSLAIEPGDLLAVHSAGAYGFAMSSNYNTRPRPAEVMVDGHRIHVVRERETLEQLFATERTLPDPD